MNYIFSRLVFIYRCNFLLDVNYNLTIYFREIYFKKVTDTSRQHGLKNQKEIKTDPACKSVCKGNQNKNPNAQTPGCICGNYISYK